MYDRWVPGGLQSKHTLGLASLVPLQSWSRNIYESPNVAISPVEDGFPRFRTRKPRFRQRCMLRSQFKARSLIPLGTPSQACSVCICLVGSQPRCPLPDLDSQPVSHMSMSSLGFLSIQRTNTLDLSSLELFLLPRTFFPLPWIQLGNSAPGLRSPVPFSPALLRPS